jgi:hypothetical protein
MIKKRTLGGITSAALMLLAGQALSGGSMKCGIHIIHDGGRYSPGKYEVLKKCGEPTFRQGNTWVYDTGRGSSRVLRFNRGGFLASIQEGK